MAGRGVEAADGVLPPFAGRTGDPLADSPALAAAGRGLCAMEALCPDLAALAATTVRGVSAGLAGLDTADD
jgi:hypothetical protein